MSVEYGSAFVLVDYFIFYVAFIIIIIIIIVRYAVERVHKCTYANLKCLWLCFCHFKKLGGVWCTCEGGYRPGLDTHIC